MEKISGIIIERISEKTYWLNEFIGYQLSNKKLNLVIRPGSKKNIFEKYSLIKSELGQLQAELKVYETSPIAERIIAISWIVSEKPQLFEKFGFTVSDVLNTKDAHNYNEGRFAVPKNKRQVNPSIAEISLEDFLKQNFS